MDILTYMGQAFVSVLAPENLFYLVGGVLIGLVMGAIPGLTATMAIALIIPFTYYLTPTQSLIMLLGAYNAGTFGGSMSAILIGTPGTPAAAATVADGYALGRQGKTGKAIKTALFLRLWLPVLQHYPDAGGPAHCKIRSEIRSR